MNSTLATRVLRDSHLTSISLASLGQFKAHTDPSIIIGTPFPLEKLFSFVAISLIWSSMISIVNKTVLRGESQTTTRNDVCHDGALYHPAMLIAAHTIIIHIAFIICGVHPTRLPMHTLLSAFYVSFNTPQSVHQFVAAHNWSSKQKQFPIEHVTPIPKYDTTRLQNHHKLTMFGTIAGMVACAILRVLDHGMQIQRYPIPIIVGATWGSCGGIAVAVVFTILGCQ